MNFDDYILLFRGFLLDSFGFGFGFEFGFGLFSSFIVAVTYICYLLGIWRGFGAKRMHTQRILPLSSIPGGEGLCLGGFCFKNSTCHQYWLCFLGFGFSFD